MSIAVTLTMAQDQQVFLALMAREDVLRERIDTMRGVSGRNRSKDPTLADHAATLAVRTALHLRQVEGALAARRHPEYLHSESRQP
ncbi:MAG: hypothetical protein ACRDXE_10510 [Acidimicrobiales bacterium]